MPCRNCIDDICSRRCVATKPQASISPFYFGEAKDGREYDLLQGNEHEPLLIGGETYEAPLTGWTHTLMHAYCVAYARAHGADTQWDVYLGCQQVGGTDL